MTRSRLALSLALAVTLVAPAVAPAAEDPPLKWVDTGPPPGVWLWWYEPSFYTGFAPRCEDPTRIHVELGRGNQLRTTVVLGDEQIDGYAEALLYRRAMIQKLLDAGVIELTQNRAWETQGEALEKAGVAALAASRKTLDARAYHDKSLALLAELLPGRLFHVRIPLDGAVAGWQSALAALAPTPDGSAAPGSTERLRAANALLPGRLNLNGLDDELSALLDEATAAASSPDKLRPLAVRFLSRAAGGHYAASGDGIDAWEITSVYPAGTVNLWTKFEGRSIPDFGRTGVWPLIRRMKGKGVTGDVDYIATNPAYGFVPNLGYEHAGGIEYNSYHNAACRTPIGTPFLPAGWRKPPAPRDPKHPMQNLWMASRGPVSHGCTRLGTGNVIELRQMLPSRSEEMEQVGTFRNLPQCYDVFDVDGDGHEEVVGLSYFIAFKANENRTPVKVYASNEREKFYAWLYGADIASIDAGHVTLQNVPRCEFQGLHKAAEAPTRAKLPLWEAPLVPELIQFYRTKPINFDTPEGHRLIREIDRLSLGYDPDLKALRLAK